MLPLAGDVVHYQSDNADLTPRIVREGVSGVISVQWKSPLHWMEDRATELPQI